MEELLSYVIMGVSIVVVSYSYGKYKYTKGYNKGVIYALSSIRKDAEDKIEIVNSVKDNDNSESYNQFIEGNLNILESTIRLMDESIKIYSK